MLPNFVLAQMRRAAEQLMTQTCRIEQEVNAVGTWGQPSPQWTEVARNVKCRVITSRQSTRSTAGMVGEQETLVDEYRLICPAGTALEKNQRVTVDDVTYQVVNVIVARADETDTQAVIVRAR